MDENPYKSPVMSGTTPTIKRSWPWTKRRLLEFVGVAAMMLVANVVRRAYFNNSRKEAWIFTGLVSAGLAVFGLLEIAFRRRLRKK